ncbi:MAG: CHASE2 domain-containing protein [Spirochaetota bacterium]|nr:CHASE2 domain-containing protein [Spirochaetota bacterium]
MSKKKKIKHLGFNLLIALVIGIIFVIFYEFGLMRRIENPLVDAIVRSFTKSEYSPERISEKDKVVYLMTSQRSLKEMDNYYDMGFPWARKTYSKVINFLKLSGVKVIGFDAVYSESSVYRFQEDKTGDDGALSIALKGSKESIIGFQFSKTKKSVESNLHGQIDNLVKGIAAKPLDELSKIANGLSNKDEKKNIQNKNKEEILSFINKKIFEREISKIKQKQKNIEKFKVPLINADKKEIFQSYYDSELPIQTYMESSHSIASLGSQQDQDSIIRRTPLLTNLFDNYYPSLSMAAINIFYDNPQIKLEGNKLHIESKNVKRIVPLDKNGFLRLKYYGTNDVYKDYYDIDIIRLYDHINDEIWFYYKNYYLNLKDVKPILYNNKAITDVSILYNGGSKLIKEMRKLIKGKLTEIIEKVPVSDLWKIYKKQWKYYGNYNSFKKILPAEYKKRAINYDELNNNPSLVKKLRDVLKKGFESFPEVGIIDQSRKSKKRKLSIPEAFRGKIVLYGATATALLDLRPTPFYEREAGVHVHATAVDNIIKGDFLVEIREDVYVIILILILGLISAFLITELPIIWGIIGNFVLLGIVFIGSVLLYKFSNIIMDTATPIITIVASFIVITGISFIKENKDKKYIQGAFGQYLSPKVINIIMDDPSKMELGGQKREITAFFSDVAGFSTISEKLTPEELVSLLNVYLTDMCDIIAKYDGTVDKFEGDAIIAFWGAPLDEPEHAKLACYSTIEMQKRLNILTEKWKAENRDSLITNMKMRIGINSGFAVVGNMGSKQRMDYTMMGDTVNLAARLEGANKFYGTYSMISDATYLQAKNYIDVRELDKIQVVGKKEAVVVYELLGRKDETSGAKADGVELYLKALELYKQQKFKEAINIFESVFKHIPNDPPSKTYIERCNSLILEPPGPDWDGRYVLKSKG